MSTRERTERELDQLRSMLAPWREKLRSEAQFWPQFEVLAARVVDNADAEDKAFTREGIEAMLRHEGLVRPTSQVRPRRRGI